MQIRFLSPHTSNEQFAFKLFHLVEIYPQGHCTHYSRDFHLHNKTRFFLLVQSREFLNHHQPPPFPSEFHSFVRIPPSALNFIHQKQFLLSNVTSSSLCLPPVFRRTYRINSSFFFILLNSYSKAPKHKLQFNFLFIRAHISLWASSPVCVVL